MATADCSTDLYAILGLHANPESSPEELRKLYEARLAGGSSIPGEPGPPSRAALQEAWEILQDEGRRKAYDVVWQRKKQASAAPASLGADVFRRKGDDLRSAARVSGTENTKVGSLASLQESLKQYSAAVEQYSKALELAPEDFRLFGGRATCFLALENYERCHADARRCTELQPDSGRAWFLLAKALWRLGRREEALCEVERGLRAIPNERNLLELRAELGGSSRSVTSRTHRGNSFVSGHSASPAHSLSRSSSPEPPQRGGSNGRASAQCGIFSGLDAAGSSPFGPVGFELQAQVRTLAPPPQASRPASSPGPDIGDQQGSAAVRRHLHPSTSPGPELPALVHCASEKGLVVRRRRSPSLQGSIQATRASTLQ